MKFDDVSLILEAKVINVAKGLSANNNEERKAAAEEQVRAGKQSDATAEQKRLAKNAEKDLKSGRFDGKIDSYERNAEERLQYERHNQKKENIGVAYDAAKNDPSKFKEMVNNFLHINISKQFNATDKDITAFKASVEGQKIPENILGRWKYIMSASLAKKAFRQNVEEKSITKRTDEGLARSGYENNGKREFGGQGDYVIITQEDAKRLRANFPGNSDIPKTGGNIAVKRDYIKEFNKKYPNNKISELTKSSDYFIKDAQNGLIFITFKSVENQGGSQTNQINDVKHTLDSLTYNISHSKNSFKSIAVVRGAEIKKYIQKGQNGAVVYKDKSYAPIEFRRKDGKVITIPRIMSEGEWQYILERL